MIVHRSLWLKKLAAFSLALIMMIVPSLMAGTMAHATDMPLYEHTMATMVDCHDAAASAADCCADAPMADGGLNACAVACLSMAGGCMIPALPVAQLSVPMPNALALLVNATDARFTSIIGVPVTPPPKA